MAVSNSEEISARHRRNGANRVNLECMVGPIARSRLLALASGAAAAFVPHPAEPTGRLATRIELTCPGPPRDLLVTDLDGDGNADLLALIDEPGLLSIWRGLGPRLADRVEPTGFRLSDYSLGPVLLDSGALGFADRGADSWSRVSVAFDEDGRALAEREVVELDAAPRALLAWPGAGDRVVVATEAPALEVFSGTERTATPALGDGLPTCLAHLPDTDWIAVGCQAGPSLRLLGPNAAGELAELSALELDGIPRAILAHDLDADGDLEVLVVGGDRSAWVFGFESEGGTAVLRDSSAVDALHWTTGAIPIDLDAADMDGDGTPELIAAHHLDQQLGVLADFDRTGPGDVLGLYGGPSPWSVASGDLDGDAREDLAISNPGAAAVSVYFGAPDGVHEPLDVPATPAPHSMDLGDLDGDGAVEIALLSAIDPEVCWLSRTGGTWVRTGSAPVPEGADALRLLDADGDGALDLAFLWSSPKGGGLVVRFGDGRGGLARRAPLELAIPGAPYDLEVADADGDGSPELFITEATRGELLAVATDAERVHLLSRTPVGDAAGALIAVHQPDGSFAGLAVARADASGRFGAALFAPDDAHGWKELGFITTPRPPEDFASADIDGDGREDLAILMQGPHDNAAGSILVALAPGPEERGFRLQTEVAVGPKPFHVAAGDVDGDGCADLFATSQYANRVSSFRGSPDRSRALVQSFDLGAHRGCMTVALADADGNGSLDLVVGNNHSGDVSLILSY